MSRIVVAYDWKEFAESKNLKTDKIELDIEGAITESIIKKHIKAHTNRPYVDVKDWVFQVESDLV